MIHYDNKVFRPVALSGNGEVSGETLFRYRQQEDIVTAEYSGGHIRYGHLVGLVRADGSIDMRYHQVNLEGALMTGICISVPELLPDGRLRLHETWEWTSGDRSKGHSMLEEQ